MFDNHLDSLNSLSPKTVNDICSSLGLNWIAVQQLVSEQLLSFDLKRESELTETQMHELLFIGHLVVSGCDMHMIKYLLQSLEAPFIYSHNRIYFDWQKNAWIDKPQECESCEIAYEDMDTQEESGDVSVISKGNTHRLTASDADLVNEGESVATGKDLDAMFANAGQGVDVNQHKDDRPPGRNEKRTTNTIHYPQCWNDNFKAAREKDEALPVWTRYMRLALKNQLIKDGILNAD